MREDQIDRLRELSEGLAEVVIAETDPHAWPGSDKTLSELTKEERGDRYWCKKNAAATMTLLLKVVNIAGIVGRGNKPGETSAEDELDSELAAAERQAAAMLERVSQGTNVH